MSQASYIIGIDLGTTNCTMAYTPIQINDHAHPLLEQVPICQVMAEHLVETNFSMPSFIYYPLDEELQSKITQIPWSLKQKFIIGHYAKERGAELPTRLIASAKSWLCHTEINRQEKFLPLELDDKSLKMSPLDACAEFLRHLSHAWTEAMPNVSFKDQIVLVTVPASFDPSARQLVQEAAQLAGYPEIILLEEPQAAFYAWLHSHAMNWRDHLKVGDSILVIDIGGGTTDFSLISVEEENGNLALKRQAVGSHLLLGGDNIDLSLAYRVKQKLEDQGTYLDHWQMQTVIHQCRQAKEKLIGEESLKSVDITILGRGSRLIGNTVQTKLMQEEVEQLVMDGFIPLVDPSEQSPMEHQIGIQQIGLPYVKDPRISCQLAKFLSMTGESTHEKIEQFVLPTAVLFNGGTLKSGAIRKRFMNLLNQWAKKLKKPVVKELEKADYDYGVSRGAVYYGLARQGHAIRIRSGTNRSYYVGIEEAAPSVPGFSPPLRAVCIVPFGMEEGEECNLDDQEFSLVLGEQAAFRFFSRATPKLSNGEEPDIGTIVRNWKQELSELRPIEALLDKSESDGKTVKVKLKSKVTELGMLELWCEALDGRKWKLEFNIR